VAAEWRGQGVARALMMRILEELKELSVPLSTLYPATQAPYRRVGYEQAGVRLTYRLELASIGDYGSPRGVQRQGDLDLEARSRAYRRRAQATSGNLERSPWLWRRVFEPPDGSAVHTFLLGEGADAGYAALQFVPTAVKLRGEVGVRDMAVNDTAEATLLLELFSSYRSVFEAVLWAGGPVEPLLLLLPEQRYRIERRWDWMLRLVDVEKALAGRGYAPHVRGAVDLEVTDALIAANASRFTLQVEDGKAEVRRGGSGAVAIDVRGLAALYTGHATAAQLAIAGLLRASSEDQAKLAALFSGPAPWMSDFF
jgi:predicted acetyltransferase